MIDAFFGDKDDASAVSAVSAVGTSARDILFPPEAHATVASAASQHDDFHFIQEHGVVARYLKRTMIAVNRSSGSPTNSGSRHRARKNGAAENHPRKLHLAETHVRFLGTATALQLFCGSTCTRRPPRSKVT